MDATAACAASLLIDVAAGGDVVAALAARVRCLLVTSSVRTILAFEEAGRALAAQDGERKRKVSRAARAPPDRASRCCASAKTVLDAGRPIADAGERAGALVRPARELPGAERAVVFGWAIEAAREEHAGGAALAAAAHALDGQARVTTAREAEALGLALSLLADDALPASGTLLRGPGLSGRMRSSTCHASPAPRGEP
ncbi:hypothetical protein WME94_19860 [Sorangium sp. So ce429]